MIVVARRATRVLLDTSPFISFAQCGSLIPLARYLGDTAAVALDVALELRRNAAGRFPELKTLDKLRWPTGDPLALPPDLLADAESLRRLHARAGAHESENRGEIATVLLAARLGDAIVILDDELGKKLARFRSLPRLSTAQLAAEMVAAAALDEDSGLAIFDVATPRGVGKSEFSAAVGRAQSAMNGT